jgi:ribosomal protein S18 acetylase RimI-like enzyme
MDFRFEQATESDWPRIVDWQAEIEWVSLGADARQQTSPEALKAQVASQVGWMRSDAGFTNQALVARSTSGDPAGYVWVARTHNVRTGRLEASLLGQYVAPEFRGQDLGGELLELAEGWARQNGLFCLCLFVGARNSIAQRLYKSLGYEVDGLRMSKRLGPGLADEAPQ